MSAECTIQDVFHQFYSDFEKNHSLSAAQRKTAFHIMNCKTGAFGVNVSVCEECGCISIHNNSCRDRCCPLCQEFPKEKWVDTRREDVLDAPYFHVVFTVPEELNPVIYSNQKLLYDALYHASFDTLRELASDSKYLGADIGYICILHTWGSEMNYHPHIHAVVLGGGLDSGNHWKDNGEDFFLPIRVVSRLFRGKYLAELKHLWEDGKLEFHGSAECYKNHYAFKELMRHLAEDNLGTFSVYNGNRYLIVRTEFEKFLLKNPIMEEEKEEEMKKVDLENKSIFNPEEAILFYDLSRRKFKKLLGEHEDLPFIVFFRTRKLIMREEFERYMVENPEIREELKNGKACIS